MLTKYYSSKECIKFVQNILKDACFNLMDETCEFALNNDIQNIENYCASMRSEFSDKPEVDQSRRFRIIEVNYGFKVFESMQIPRSLYMVDLHDIIIALSESPKIYSHLSQSYRSTHGFSSFFDGSFYSKSANEDLCDLNLYISIYADEINVCCPIGKNNTFFSNLSKGAFKRNQKFLNFYCQILNFPSHILSRTDSIFLLAIINCKELADESIERATGPLFHMINQSKQRLLQKNIRLTIAYFAGDTPICQAFCGMSEGVGNANFPCRKCKTHKSNILDVKNENSAAMRSIGDYDTDTSTGIKFTPCFLSYNLIDPIQQTPMDIMHVVLEGICRRQVMNIFDDWIETKRTNASELDTKVKHFPYGYVFKDSKIPGISKFDLQKNQFIVSASQMKTLILLFPYIFETIVDMNHEEYKY